MEQKDLTRGSIYRVLLSFALPYMAANLLQSLYGAADLWVIGKYCRAEAVAAVSTATQLTQIVSSLIAGLSMGSTILIAKLCGAKQFQKLKHSIGTSLSCFLIFGIALGILMLLLKDWLLHIMNTPQEAMSLAGSYISICALGNVFVCGYNAVSAVLRGCGDSRRPMIFIALACVLNIVLDIVFVKYLGLGVSGTAYATIFSQAISMISSVIYLKKKSSVFDFKLRSFKIHRDMLARLLKIGIPVSLQELLIRISFLYIAYAMNSCGLYAAAVVGIGSKYDVFAMLTSNSMAAALTAFTAQNMGAGKRERAEKALWLCMGISLAVSLLFFLWAQLSPGSMIGVFSKNPQIIAQGSPYFRSASWDYLMVALLFCLNGYLNGREKTVWTMISSAFSAVFLRIPAAYLVMQLTEPSLGSIGMVAPAVTAFTAAYTLIYVLREKKKNPPLSGD